MTPPSTSQRRRKLSRGAKLAFASGSLEEAMVGAAGIATMLYYNQVLGVSAALCGTAFLIASIVDAVSDPTVGAISDSVRTRWGRRLRSCSSRRCRSRQLLLPLSAARPLRGRPLPLVHGVLRAPAPRQDLLYRSACRPRRGADRRLRRAHVHLRLELGGHEHRQHRADRVRADGHLPDHRRVRQRTAESRALRAARRLRQRVHRRNGPDLHPDDGQPDPAPAPETRRPCRSRRASATGASSRTWRKT